MWLFYEGQTLMVSGDTCRFNIIENAHGEDN
jgi:hypothetical protein